MIPKKQFFFKNPKLDKTNILQAIYDKQVKKDSSFKAGLIDMYGKKSWYLLFAKRFQDSEKEAKKGLLIDSTANWIKVNLAHALLFQGRYKEAKILYTQLKNATYGSDCLNDFNNLQKRGVYNADVEKIREILK